METLTVSLAGRAYPIHIGRGLAAKSELLLPYLAHAKTVVVSNTTVAPLHLERLVAPLRARGVEVVEIILPDGEKFKDWTTLNTIFDVLLAAHCERSTTLIALGGGVVGDMTGFAAACYQRGVAFIQVPTTLLAQVDSSIGGKTGINHPAGKNMIGAFHQPRLVLADSDFLQTLPDRELRAGLAEIFKIALIRDAGFLDWLEENLAALLARDAASLEHAILRACRNKAEVVVADERESGERALLNFGHTFGHAIEAGLGFGAWLHGEAVAAGMMMAAELSRRLGWIGPSEVARIETLLEKSGLPVQGPALGADRYLELMRHDKKVEGGRLRLVLLKEIGVGVVSDAAPAEQIAAAIEARSADV